MSLNVSDKKSPADERLRLKGSPLSAPINVMTLPTKGRTTVLQPKPDVLAALADELGVETVNELDAKITVKRWQRDGIRLTGPLMADLVQACVVTLEPVPERIETQIDAVFVPDTSKLAKPKVGGDAQELIIDAEGPDAPEVFEPPELDVGAVVHEFLALSLDPYPRAPDAPEQVLAKTADADADEQDDAPHPFAALAQLKSRGAGED